MLPRKDVPMPFPHRPAAPPPQGGDRQPLFRIAGLWPSKNGNGLSGSARLSYADREGMTVGQRLQDLVQQAIDGNLELRFLVFETKPGQQGPPYTVHVALGREEQARGGGGYQDPRQSAPESHADPVPPPPARRIPPRRA